MFGTGLDLLTAAVFLGGLAAFGAFALALGSAGGEARARLKRRLEAVRGGRAREAPAVHASLRRTGAKRARALDSAVQRLLPSRSGLEAQLARTGREIRLSAFVLGSLGLGLSAVLLALVLGVSPWLALVLGLALGLALPRLWLARMAARRTKRFLDLFPDAIDVVVRSVRSGLPVAEAVNAIATEFVDPVGTEFQRVADAVKLGSSLEEALWKAAARLGLPEFNFFVISLSVQRETGGNLAETLSNLADILRRRHQMKLKVRAMSSEARASAMILGFLPFVIFLVLFVVNGQYVMRLFDDPRGLLLLAFGLVSQAVGVGIMMKMARFEI